MALPGMRLKSDVHAIGTRTRKIHATTMTFVWLGEAAIHRMLNAYMPAVTFPTAWSIVPAAKKYGVSSLGYVEIEAIAPSKAWERRNQR